MSASQDPALAKVSTVLASDLERPELDNRQYRVIRLQNGLEALLVHDPDTDKSSAAMDVRVGSFADSEDLPVSILFVRHIPAEYIDCFCICTVSLTW